MVKVPWEPCARMPRDLASCVCMNVMADTRKISEKDCINPGHLLLTRVVSLPKDFAFLVRCSQINKA